MRCQRQKHRAEFCTIKSGAITAGTALAYLQRYCPIASSRSPRFLFPPGDPS